MEDKEEYSFDEKEIADAVASARATYSDAAAATASTQAAAFDLSRGLSMAEGSVEISAQCISVTTRNRQICINLPLGLGRRCFTIPVRIPNGTVGQACLSICTRGPFPTGVKVTIRFGGVTILSQSFGFC
jgi:hypothetical protein